MYINTYARTHALSHTQQERVDVGSELAELQKKLSLCEDLYAESKNDNHVTQQVLFAYRYRALCIHI